MSNDPYWDGMFEIVSNFRENKELVKKMLFKFPSFITILNEVYLYLTRLKDIEPIENLPEEKKWELRRLSKFKKTDLKRMEFIRAYYLMEII